MSVSPEDRMARLEEELARERRRSRRDDEPPQAKKNNSNILLVIAVAVIISVMFTIWYSGNRSSSFVTKADFDSKFSAASTQLTQAQSSVKSAVDSIPNTVTTQINNVLSNVTAQINNMVNAVNDMKSQIATQNGKIDNAVNIVNALNPKIDVLSKSDTDINAKITALQTQLATDEATIKLLQQTTVTTSGGTSTAKKITVAIKSLGNNSLYPINSLDANGNSPPGTDTIYDGLQGSIRLNLTNNTNVDITDATIDVQFSIYPPIPTSFTPSLSGGSVPWQREYSDSQNLEFYNGAWGLSIPAGQTISLSLTLTIQGTNSAAYNISGGYYFQLQAIAE